MLKAQSWVPFIFTSVVKLGLFEPYGFLWAKDSYDFNEWWPERTDL